jgi:hypothetical protein
VAAGATVAVVCLFVCLFLVVAGRRRRLRSLTLNKDAQEAAAALSLAKFVRCSLSQEWPAGHHPPIRIFGGGFLPFLGRRRHSRRVPEWAPKVSCWRRKLMESAALQADNLVAVDPSAPAIDCAIDGSHWRCEPIKCRRPHLLLLLLPLRSALKLKFACRAPLMPAGGFNVSTMRQQVAGRPAA